MKNRLVKRLLTWAIVLTLSVGAAVYVANWWSVRSERKMRQHLQVASVSELQELSKKRDWDPEVFYWLGSRLTMEGNHKEALKALARSAALNPNSSAARSMLATELVRLDKPQEAEGQFKKALELAPRNVYAHYALGCLYAQYNRNEQAVESLKRASELDPKMLDSQYRLAECYGKLYQEDLKLDLLEKVTQADPNNIAYLKSLGYVQIFFSKFAEAEQTYRRILAIDPNDQETHYLLGRALAEQASTPEAFVTAEKELTDVATKVPENPGVHLALGILYFRRNAPEKAVAELEKAVKLGITENKTYLYLGQSYMRVGKRDEGAKTLTKFQRLAKINRDKSHLENRLLNLPPDTSERLRERAEARLQLAKVYMDDQDYRHALDHLTLLLEEDKDNPEVKRLYVKCQERLKQPSQENQTRE